MGFKWDWEKKELVPGEGSEEAKPFWFTPVVLSSLGLFMYGFIEYAAPWLGRLFFGGFL